VKGRSFDVTRSVRTASARGGAVLRWLIVGALLATVVAADSPQLGDGYWHVSGNRVLDAANQEVRVSGVQFTGFDAANYVPHGTWGGIGRNWKSYLNQIKALGFNVIKVPFSGDTFDPGRMPQNVDYGANPDLRGKTTLEVLDMLVNECRKRGIRIVLGYHRIQAGSFLGSGLWYLPGSTTYTEQYWIDTWKALVGRYVGNPTVVGCDLFNEVHAAFDGSYPGPFWSADGVDEPYNWRTAAKRAAEAILSVNPNLLICVQGMDGYAGKGSWWGANWMGLKDHPFDISKPGQVVYVVHDYGPNVWEQPWHDDPGFPANLPAFWDAQWGFVHDQGIGPVWIGEWGSRLDHPKEQEWATTLRDYIRSKGLSWTWWEWFPVSRDTGGILQDDWKTAWPEKLELVRPVQYPQFPAPDTRDGEGCASAPARRGYTTGRSGRAHAARSSSVQDLRLVEDDDVVHVQVDADPFPDRVVVVARDEREDLRSAR